jgi:hypothetical protein
MLLVYLDQREAGKKKAEAHPVCQKWCNYDASPLPVAVTWFINSLFGQPLELLGMVVILYGRGC